MGSARSPAATSDQSRHSSATGAASPPLTGIDTAEILRHYPTHWRASAELVGSGLVAALLYVGHTPSVRTVNPIGYLQKPLKLWCWSCRLVFEGLIDDHSASIAVYQNDKVQRPGRSHYRIAVRLRFKH